MICNKFDVVTVPFPFSDKLGIKKRPALVVSSHEQFNYPNKSVVLAMITTTQNEWLNDIWIQSIKSTGLTKKCKVRFKFFTLDSSLVVTKIGKLDKIDQFTVLKAMTDICLKGEG